VIEPLKQISRLSEAELTAAVIASFFTVFIKNIPTGQMGAGYIPSDQVVSSDDPSKEKLYEMGPGSTIGLQDGEDIEVADPKRPNNKFAPFFEAIVQQIGCGIELPAEQILMVYNASYSASRGAMLEAWKAFKSGRFRLVSNFCQPVYEEWLMEAILRGRISAPGFLEDPVIRQAWSNSKWTGPGQGMINPESEIKASREAIEGNLSTHEEEYSERTGEDWEGMVRTLAREKKLLASLGVVDTPLRGGPSNPFGDEEDGEAPGESSTEEDQEEEEEASVKASR
jgi:lambda family phage portal protein